MLSAVATATRSQGHCQFPGCGTPLPARTPGQRGAPRRYCDNPDHTPQKALRLLRSAGAEVAVQHPSPHPVTDGAHTLSGLLDRYSHLREELAAIGNEADDLLARLTDPTAVVREIDEIQRRADHRIALAEQACAEAEHAYTAMAERVAHAVEAEGHALTAAREARVLAEEASQRSSAVEHDAVARIAAAEHERDQAQENAESEVAGIRAGLEAARLARAHAEAERDSIRAENHALATENASLREILDAERAEHRRRIEHRDVEYGRAITAAHVLASRTAREHRAQLNDVIDRVIEALRTRGGAASSHWGAADDTDSPP
ncbi:hypothetical protein IU510_21220 [Nocardia cyriacigeorgica]|uniref:hypothetical protein n=1 Tax=Nocardia cyriacigeorgica TaxID=135487 RepID=UPI001894048F|nr:hypothetical protein [Nocardia cyriacigeorgica]MBF6100582.1 hypothetical protein [Nocardia cyriacigeorgica]